MDILDRTIKSALNEFLQEKIVLLTGPRQVGKTTLAKQLRSKFDYLNFDESTHRSILSKKEWKRDTDLVIFDEIHKMRGWKRWLKGIYDTEGVKPQILVTGSARMDTYRKGGDSLAGRHYLLHLLPLSVREVDQTQPQKVLDQMLIHGSFPEPFFKNSDRASKLWRKSHLDVILREDLLDLENVKNIKGMELLIDLLAQRVGSTLSYASLAKDLEVSPHTIKHWIAILSSLYIVFVVTPYSKQISKAIVKEPKIYFYDTGRVTAGEAARVENTVAIHLLKRALFLQDVNGEETGLFYLKDKEKREIDFVTVLNHKLEYLIEVKTSDNSFSNSLIYYQQKLNPLKGAVQAVYHLDRERQTESGLKMVLLSTFLNSLET